MTSYRSTSATPSFSWAHPEQETQSKPSPAANGKPFSNPLLRPSFAASAPSSTTNLPFSPVQNIGIRQRRSKENRPSQANAPDTATKNDKGLVRPPKASFLVNGDVGVSNETTSERTTTSTTATPVSSLSNDSLERWVLVYGYGTSAQYDAIVHRFTSIGSVVSHRGICRPGRANWIAFEYESTVQAEKALCQSNSLLMDGVFVAATRLTLPVKQKLEWNPVSLSSLPDVASRLDDKFHQTDVMTEEDILVSSSPRKQRQQQSVRRSVCERFLAWWFGWEYDE